MYTNLTIRSMPVSVCYDGETEPQLPTVPTMLNPEVGDDDSSAIALLEARRQKEISEAAEKIVADKLAAKDKEVDRRLAEAATRAKIAAEQAKLDEPTVDGKFTQDQLNRFLADDRRKHQQKYEGLEEAYKEALQDQNLGQEQRDKLQTQLEDLQKQFRSKEQQLAYEKKQLETLYQSDMEKLTSRATEWEDRFKTTLRDRALQDAAVMADAFNPAQVVTLLTPMTKIADEVDDAGHSTGKLVPVIDFPDVDETTGKHIMTQRTPEEAVKRMKALPDQFGNLFKANVVSGIGGNSATGGVTPGEGGRIDPSNLTQDQYNKIRRENPEALGLKGR